MATRNSVISWAPSGFWKPGAKAISSWCGGWIDPGPWPVSARLALPPEREQARSDDQSRPECHSGADCLAEHQNADCTAENQLKVGKRLYRAGLGDLVALDQGPVSEGSGKA